MLKIIEKTKKLYLKSWADTKNELELLRKIIITLEVINLVAGNLILVLKEITIASQLNY